VRAHNRLVEILGSRLTLVDLFKYPTIHAVVQLLTNEGLKEAASQRGRERAQARSRHRTSPDSIIAVIGMACRFPGADTLDEFWRNLATGTESVTFFDDPEIARSGIDPAVARHPDYVKASPILSDIESFDADLFGYSARDAMLMDPQHRLMLECAWEALETAGYDPFTYAGEIGVYAGASMNTYLLNNVYPKPDKPEPNRRFRRRSALGHTGYFGMICRFTSARIFPQRGCKLSEPNGFKPLRPIHHRIICALSPINFAHKRQ